MTTKFVFIFSAWSWKTEKLCREAFVSPLFTSLHRQQQQQIRKQRKSSSPLVQSTESSFLDAWPIKTKQPSLTISQQIQHPTIDLYDDTMDAYDSVDEMNQDETTTIQQSNNSKNKNEQELMSLRQQEQLMIQQATEMENHISQLMEEIQLLKQQQQ